MSLSCPIVRRTVGLGPKPIKKRLPFTPCSETHVSESAHDKVSESSIPGTKSISSRLGQVCHGEDKCKASLHIFCDEFCSCSSVSFKEEDESNSLDSNLGSGSLLEKKGYEPFQENETEEELDPEVYDLEEEYDPKEVCDLEEEYDPEEVNYPEEEYSPKEVCDPEEEYDPEEDYDPEEEYDPQEDYDPVEEYNHEKEHNPEEDYVPQEEHNPEEDYDPEEEYDPEEDYVPEEEHNPEEEDYVPEDEQNPEKDYDPEEEYDPEEDCHPEKNYDPEKTYHTDEYRLFCSDKLMTVVFNKHRGYVEKEIIHIDSDDAEEEYCPEEEDDPEDGFFCSSKLEHAHASTQTEGTAELDLCVSEEKAIASNLGMEDSTYIVSEDRGYVEKEIIDVDSDDQHADGFRNETFNPGNKECVEIVKKMQEKRIHEIFLEGFASNATKDDIKKSFGELGKAVNIKLKTDPQRNKNKVFAILSFATAEQADHALINLRRPLINGKRCDMYPADPVKCNNTLFLGNVCKKWTKETLEEKLNHFGIKKFKDLRLAEDAGGAGLKCGYAFLELHSQSDAINAYKRLQQRDVILEADRSAKVCFAFPFIDLEDNTGTQVKRVFLDKLPASWDNYHVRKHFEKFGEIKKIELARHMPSAPRRDFGFITYESHTAAVACLEFIKRASFHKGESKVNIKAMLSHPLTKRTSKHQICGNFLVKQESASSDVREPQGPALTSGSHRHRIENERPRKESFRAGSHKRPVEVMDRGQEPASRCVRDSQGPALTRGSQRHRTEKERLRKESFGVCSYSRQVDVRYQRQCKPLKGRVRPLPSGPVQKKPNPKKSTEYHPREYQYYGSMARSVGPRNSFAMSRDTSYSQNKNVYEDEAYGDPRSWNSAGVSTSTPHPKNLRLDLDAGGGKSYVRTLPYCSERHSTNYASLSGLKRSSSALNDVPSRYSNKKSKVQKRNWSSSQGCQAAAAHSERVTVKMEYSYRDIHQNRRHFGYQEYKSRSVDDRRHFPYQRYDSESFDDRRYSRYM